MTANFTVLQTMIKPKKKVKFTQQFKGVMKFSF